MIPPLWRDICGADEKEREQFEGYFHTLSFKLRQQQRRYHKEVIESLLRSILFDYLEMMMAALPQMEEATTTDGQHKVLFRRFLELLTTRHVKHQLVDTYAQELYVSPNYLTKVCREVTGKTALRWVREYREADIRYYLMISYPIYITHYPLIYMHIAWVRHHPEATLGQNILISLSVFVASILLAYGAYRLYDIPVREWLKNKLFTH